MLTPPDITHDAIQACLAETYGLQATRIEFLPLGADVHSAVFRVQANDGTAYFLKLRSGDFEKSAVAVPAFLHRDKGIAAVMAPLPTTDHQLSVQRHGFEWMLYPFFEGRNGFERALTAAQWTALGAALGIIHRTELPPELLAGVPKESYAHQWREGVRRYQRRFINGFVGDAIVQRFHAFWGAHDEEIETLVYRSEQLASILLEKALPQVLCHADIHAGNVLVGNDGQIAIVDWDTLMLAPKERDLMFIGGGVGHVWNQPQEETPFYQGYGATDIDPVALAYYRHERIVRDILEFSDQVFDASASAEDREEAMRQMASQFKPDDVVAIAHRSYEAVT
ncbi:phosphotransferase enzyme family protein [Variovorax boronicumulans]|uniref:phosphotransferase enzyme family protein n=1 Tax=Variovorax boronicumulans TaxID=436515 RepID=UPI003397AE5E